VANVQISEQDCAIDDKPVNWMLVTSLPIASFAQAHQLLEWWRVLHCFSIRLKLFFALQGRQ